MESLGKLHKRYYVIKTDGIFSKSPKLLHICQNGLEFKSINYSKPNKTPEIFFFKELNEISIISSSNNDLLIKIGKNQFTLTCTDRLNLLIDILFYKDIWDLDNTPPNIPEIPSFIGFRQVDLADTSSKILVTIQSLRSGILVEYSKKPIIPMPDQPEKSKSIIINEEKIPKRYFIRYNEIEFIIPINSGIIINSKVFFMICLM